MKNAILIRRGIHTMCFIHLRFEIYVEFLCRNFLNLFLLHISHRSSDLINQKWVKYLQCLGFFRKKFQFLIGFSWVNTVHTILCFALLCLHRIFKLFLSVFKYSWRVFYTRTHTRMITCSFWCVSYQLCLTFYFKNRIKHKKSCHCRWGLRFRVECRLWNPLGLSSAEATTQTHT